MTLEYAHLVSGIRQGWNERVCKDCAILHTHEEPHQGYVGNLIASTFTLLSLHRLCLSA